MFAENRRRIAEHQEFFFVEDSFLCLRKVLRTEKARALSYGFRIDVRSRADDAPGIELEPYGVAATRDLTQSY